VTPQLAGASLSSRGWAARTTSPRSWVMTKSNLRSASGPSSPQSLATRAAAKWGPTMITSHSPRSGSPGWSAAPRTPGAGVGGIPTPRAPVSATRADSRPNRTRVAGVKWPASWKQVGSTPGRPYR